MDAKLMPIGKALMGSLPFPPAHTVHASFPAHGVPSWFFRVESVSFVLRSGEVGVLQWERARHLYEDFVSPQREHLYPVSVSSIS